MKLKIPTFNNNQVGPDCFTSFFDTFFVPKYADVWNNEKYRFKGKDVLCDFYHNKEDNCVIYRYDVLKSDSFKCESINDIFPQLRGHSLWRNEDTGRFDYWYYSIVSLKFEIMDTSHTETLKEKNGVIISPILRLERYCDVEEEERFIEEIKNTTRCRKLRFFNKYEIEIDENAIKGEDNLIQSVEFFFRDSKYNENGYFIENFDTENTDHLNAIRKIIDDVQKDIDSKVLGMVFDFFKDKL